MPAPKGFKPVNGFKKGVVTNPNGRPRETPERVRIMSRAAGDYEALYDVIREAALVDKAPWAVKLLYEHQPKYLRESVDMFPIIQDHTSTDTQIESLRKGLGAIEYHDIDSATTILKALSSTKIADSQSRIEEASNMDNKALLAKLDRVLEEVDKEKE